ncbi:stage VI sporulation protein D [Alkalihalobacillus sp. BA299]|uniref:stage VI sporulation protein D n=1 Tax=Alkalihalobacillus sp. BA299 TaxID=2815938 RepID=UPI001ADB2DF7|nr:stage VI sporulation protein D [Alkalihalobacillus sp. BA299]
MTQDHPSKLSFSIEESVWLNKGQEVAEILSMSLDPEIRIEEKNDHVVIKGGLRLYGEYRPVQNETEDTKEEEVAFRSFEEVTLNDQNIGEIKHFFPIDVTIPLSRIQNIDDVYVQVESFDYDLPEKSCLQLTADVAISGMSTQQEEVKRPDFPTEPTLPESFPQMERPPSFQPFPAFSFEAKKQATPNYQVDREKPEEEAKNVVPFTSEYESGYERRNGYTNYSETPKYEIESDEQTYNQEHTVPSQARESNIEARPEVIEPKEPSPITNFVPTHSRSSEQVTNSESEFSEEENVEAVEEQEDETKINFAPLKKLSERPPADIEVEAETVEDEQLEQSVESVKEPKSRQDENALYLTKMLADGEEQFSKLKMCIIQENESLDTIAERYELSTSQIIRVNRLNEERVEEGQILYIPVGSKR